jgi:4-amino-4-deoxy-L-arabinose transferase-like glycosyltransferase
LGLIAAIGFLLRLTYLYVHRDRLVRVDGFVYLISSEQVADGGGFLDPFTGQPSAKHPPAWTSFLAIVRALGATSTLHLQVAASALGTAAIAAIGVVGTRITSQRGALIGAGLAALYPGFWYYERELLSESLAIPVAAGLVWTAYRYIDRRSLVWAGALGAMCAVLGLTRGEQILLAAFLVAPLILTDATRRLRMRVATLGIAAVATVAVLAPWFVYNLSRFEDPVLIATGMGSAMAQGSCPNVYSGSLLGFHDLGCAVQAQAGLDAALDETQVDREMRTFAVDHTLDHLDRLPAVLAARQGRTWGFYRPFQTAELEAGWAGSPVWVLHAGTISFWVLVIPATRGAWALRRRWEHLLPLVAPFAVVAVTVALTFGQPRYRAPADVGLMLLAAVGLDAWTRRSWRRAP